MCHRAHPYTHTGLSRITDPVPAAQVNLESTGLLMEPSLLVNDYSFVVTFTFVPIFNPSFEVRCEWPGGSHWIKITKQFVFFEMQPVIGGNNVTLAVSVAPASSIYQLVTVGWHVHDGQVYLRSIAGSTAPATSEQSMTVPRVGVGERSSVRMTGTLIDIHEIRLHWPTLGLPDWRDDMTAVHDRWSALSVAAGV